MTKPGTYVGSCYSCGKLDPRLKITNKDYGYFCKFCGKNEMRLYYGNLGNYPHCFENKRQEDKECLNCKSKKTWFSRFCKRCKKKYKGKKITIV